MAFGSTTQTCGHQLPGDFKADQRKLWALMGLSMSMVLGDVLDVLVSDIFIWRYGGTDDFLEKLCSISLPRYARSFGVWVGLWGVSGPP